MYVWWVGYICLATHRLWEVRLLSVMVDCKLGRISDDSKSTVLVISPVTSLMSEQVILYRRRGVSAAILCSGYGDRIEKSLLATEQYLQTPGNICRAATCRIL